MLLLLALMTLAIPVAAAESKPIDPVLLRRFEARTFQDPSGTKLNYRLFKPDNYQASTNYPVVLFLHGAAGLGDDNQRQFNGGNEVPPMALTDGGTQLRFPSFVMVPQCPRGESWSGLGTEPARMIRATLAALDALGREFSFDQGRLYLIGVSMGGNGVWDVATRFPGKFAAAVPICGAGDPDSARSLVDLPIWCFHGAADPLISVDYARRMVAALRKAGGTPRYTEYPGVGHDSYRNAFKEPEFLPWLYQQRKGAHRAR